MRCELIVEYFLLNLWKKIAFASFSFLLKFGFLKSDFLYEIETFAPTTIEKTNSKYNIRTWSIGTFYRFIPSHPQNSHKLWNWWLENALQNLEKQNTQSIWCLFYDRTKNDHLNKWVNWPVSVWTSILQFTFILSLDSHVS